MKKIYILLFVLLSATGTRAQWVPQEPNTSNSLNAVYFIDENLGFAVGDSGTILRTTDGGTTWNHLISGTNNILMSVYFQDANTGYAAGMAETILKTTNAGLSWSVISSGTYPWLYSLHFPQPGTGYAVGAEGAIIKTTNAGATWSRQSSGIFTLTAVYFPSVNIGYAVGGAYYPESTILYTNNGGYPLGEIDHSPASGTLSIFPNPATSSITVETASHATGISILDLSGRELLQKAVPGTKFTMDITTLPSGLYLVKLTGGTSVEFGKFFKR